MIFVTVGTHEQSFKRLVLAIDHLAGKMKGKQEFIVQQGYTYEKLFHCKSEKFFPFDQMQQFYDQADVIITHGGPSSFMEVLAKKKSPIVVPRKLQFHEHVNDHQLTFALKIKEVGYPIEVVEEVSDLEMIINNRLHQQDDLRINSHNQQFNEGFKQEVMKLF